MVVEGPSAAGKTTWLKRLASRDQTIPEHGAIEVPADRVDDEAQFWTGLNAARWARALAIETATGRALCDGDPLKLSYDYCLARIGALPWPRFDAGIETYAAAIRARRLGIADAIFCSIPDIDALDSRQREDPTRRRGNFAVNRRLGPPLRDWYGALNQLDPGRVEWAFPATIPVRAPRERYDLQMFTTWMARLPGRSETIR